MHTKEKGTMAEGAVMAALLQHGKTVLLPWGENNRYDLALDDNGKLVRIQIKKRTPAKRGHISGRM